MNNKIINKAVSFFRNNMPWVIMIIIALVLNLFSNNFLSWQNIYNILAQNSYIVVAALGVTLIMMSGQMDLSVGYQISLTAILTAMMVVSGFPIWLCIIGAMCVGIICCCVTCIISIKLQIPLIMVSLGIQLLCQGASYEISNAVSIYGYPKSFSFLGSGDLFGLGIIAAPTFIALLILIIMSVILNRTYFGRYIYAVGSNSEAADLAGINVRGVRLMISAIEGACIGLAAVLMIARVGSAHSSMGVDLGFTCITATMLGGVSMRGGDGKLTGPVAGVLILGLLSNGMQMAKMGSYAQYICKGAILLLAIAMDVAVYKHKHARKRIKQKEEDSRIKKGIS